MSTESPTTESPRRKRRIGGGPLVALVLVLLPILYVLSVGPAEWLFQTGRLSGESFDSLYFPVQYAVRHNDSIRRAVEWYFTFWLP